MLQSYMARSRFCWLVDCWVLKEVETILVVRGGGGGGGELYDANPPSLVDLLLRFLLLAGGFVLRPDKLRIVDESVLVVIVRAEDGIDQRGQFIVGEDFVLVAGLAGLLLGFAFLVPMNQRFDQLAPI